MTKVVSFSKLILKRAPFVLCWYIAVLNQALVQTGTPWGMGTAFWPGYVFTVSATYFMASLLCGLNAEFLND